MTADTSVAEHAARLAERAGEVALCLDFDGAFSPLDRLGERGAGLILGQFAKREGPSLSGMSRDPQRLL